MAIQINIGPDRDTLASVGDSLQDAIESKGELENIQRRTARYAGRFKHRKQGKFDFYEYVAKLGKYPDVRYAVKRISIATEDKQAYVGANEPWTMYDSETGETHVQFDFITDAMKEVGWTDEATKGWHKATRDEKNNVWVPAAE